MGRNIVPIILSVFAVPAVLSNLGSPPCAFFIIGVAAAFLVLSFWGRFPGLKPDLKIMRGLFDSFPHALVVYDGKGKIKYSNNNFALLMGCPKKDILDCNISGLMKIAVVGEIDDDEKSCFFSCNANEGVFEIKKGKNGGTGFVGCQVYRLDQCGGNMKVLIMRALDARQKTHKGKIDYFSEFYKNIIENMDYACIAVDKEGKIHIFNQEAERQLQMTHMLGKRTELALPPNINILLKRALLQREYSDDTIYFKINNQEFSAFAKSIVDGEDDIVGASLFFRNISKEKEKNKILRDKDMQAMLAQLAVGIAHEFRQPLTSIKGFAQLIKRESQGNKKILGYSGIIIDEMNRMDAIVGEFLDFARPDKLESKKISLNKLINDMVYDIEDICGEKDIQVYFNSNLSLPIIEVDEIKIRKVILNIVHNSIEAMERGGGKLTIGTGLDGGYVALSIKDTGRGIPREKKDEILLPFYTTSPNRPGLGLSFCKSIIEQHGGQLVIYSREGEGTEVKIKLAHNLPWVQNHLFPRDLEEKERRQYV
ncbi:MAG: hypothetical protein GX318_07890 [Clostridia bacterium]|nr:hypothetical protein [Clostridia bacterium]